MVDNAVRRLLAIFVLSLLFLIKVAICMEDTSGEADQPLQLDTLFSEEIQTQETPATEASLSEPAASEEISLGGDIEAEVELPTETEEPELDLSDLELSELDEETPTVKEVDKTSKETTVSRKTPRAKQKSAVKSKSRKKSAKAAKRKTAAVKRVRPETEVEKISKFDSSGKLESFKTTAENVSNFIKKQKTLKPQDRVDLYSVLAKFRFFLGKEGFSEDGHYKAVGGLLKTASENSNLFSKYQLKQIEEWKISTEKELSNPKLRKQPLRSRINKKAIQKSSTPLKTPQRKDIREIRKTISRGPVTKSPVVR